jgi:hypothetical protein
VLLSKYSIFPICALLGGGCGRVAGTDASSDDVSAGSEIAAVEQEFGLVKDERVAGAWTRSDEALKAGGCYDPQAQVRRYKTGAAFFRADGLCIDVDGYNGSVKVTGWMLDLALRYHLGAPLGHQGGAGHSYVDFAKGTLEIAEPSRYCGFRFDPDTHAAPLAPPLQSGLDAYKACKAGGGDNTACYRKAVDTCTAAAVTDAARDTIDRPSYDGDYIYAVSKGEPGAKGPAPDLLMLVYKFAKAHPETPFGANTAWGEDLAFEHLDARRTVDATSEQLTIVKKDGGAPLAQCTRPLSAAEFQCTGM